MVLDQRKDEAIERTFQQVQTNFKEIFERLVPQGRGELIMQRKLDGEITQQVDIEAPPSDIYTGIGIKVCFLGYISCYLFIGFI